VVFSIAVRDTRAKKRVIEIRPLGCRELRAPTWLNLTSLYAARLLLRAAQVGALIDFIRSHVQAFPFLSSVTGVISVVSTCPSAGSDFELFHPI
jgi:hypothetical protein